jgi:hypothetical protein
MPPRCCSIAAGTCFVDGGQQVRGTDVESANAAPMDCMEAAAPSAGQLQPALVPAPAALQPAAHCWAGIDPTGGDPLL